MIGTVCVLCGDGVLVSPEICDDGNKLNGDGCDQTCLVETGFNCTTLSPSTCTPICGDGLIKGSEPCDDKNLLSNDGCD